MAPDRYGGKFLQVLVCDFDGPKMAGSRFNSFPTDMTPQPLPSDRRADDGAASLPALPPWPCCAVPMGGGRCHAGLAGRRHRPHAQRRDLTGQLSAVPGWIAAARASGPNQRGAGHGDPLCHGIASLASPRACALRRWRC